MSLKSKKPDEEWEKKIYLLMIKFNELDMDKIKKIALPTVLELDWLIEWEAKERERAKK